MEENLSKLKVKDEVSAYPLEISPVPEYVQHRIKLFDTLYAQYQNKIAAQPRVPIKISLLDGRIVEGVSWETTPFQIAKNLSNSLAEKLVIAKVDGKLYDSTRPFEKDSVLELLDFDHDEGRQVFWHSSAHVLGEVCEKHYGCLICIGPPVEDGFFYEMAIKDRAVCQTDYPAMETLAKNIIKEKQAFIRLEMTKADLLEMFKYNPYKVHLIKDKILDGTCTTVYRCGPLIDLCYGPHIPDTGKIKAFKVMKNSSSYFLGDSNNDSLQRVYGVSFPDNKLMKEHLKFIEEAEKRDHRKLGKDQQLFFFHDASPGSCFFLPHGTRIYNTLQNFIRSEYQKRGFTEVITPNIFNVNLWKNSGHWENYKENMFSFELEKELFALKPMNCPGHCLMFGHRERSYRELPIRLADFGVLHRNELSGALSGLTRVRRFQQDDAHIFCRQDQIESEMKGAIDFLHHVYTILGFTYSLKLSTRPEKFLGEIETWNFAEKQLENVLNECGHPWELNLGDGAFYGPKIDITIMDAHKRRHQCATIQLDFQLPIRFGLKYRSGGSDGSDEWKVPVIIHRAILGSVERLMAVLTENYGGNWPLWLSPRQVMVVPVSHATASYAEKLQQILHTAGYYADVDLSDLTFNKKIRNAEITHYNFILVVGAQEEQAGTVNVRKVTPGGEDKLLTIDEVLIALTKMKDSKTRQMELVTSE